ncbi:MAG: VOC family protein [Acidimicrobiales bacterium]
MDVLSARVIVYPAEFERSRRFYEAVLGLHIYREWGSGVVYFLGGAFLELSQGEPAGGAAPVALWLQVRDVNAEEARLRALGVEVVKPAARMPWGLVESWVLDPDGLVLHLVEVPPEHPLRSGRR